MKKLIYFITATCLLSVNGMAASLATGKKVNASIDINRAEIVVDGNKGGPFWASHHKPGWFSVDLTGADSKLQLVDRIILYTYHSKGRAYQFSIEGSKDGKEWYILSNNKDNEKVTSFKGYEIKLEPTKLRYIRVHMYGNNLNPGSHVREIDVFAGAKNEEELKKLESYPKKGAVDMGKAVLSIGSSKLKLTLTDKGIISSLKYPPGQKELIHSKEASYLMLVETYSNKKKLLEPTAMKVISRKGDTATVKLSFPENITTDIQIKENDGWLSLKLTGAENVKEISRIQWGPYNTNIMGAVGEYFGLLHSEDITLGLMSLEPNTDGVDPRNRSICADWLTYPKKGSYMMLESWDHTRKRNWTTLRSSEPVPGFTVIGSAVALHCSGKGKTLDLVEKVVKEEGLPYLKFKGEWAKKSQKIKAPSIWAYYDQSNVEEFMDIAKELSANNICPFGKMFGNWGHFDLDPKLYPGGIPAIHNISAKCKERGLNFTMYTLTNFIKPIEIPEPYITPEVDLRFEKFDLVSSLQEPVDKKSTQMKIKKIENFETYWKLQSIRGRVIKLGNELISPKKYTIKGDSIILEDCKRGFLMTNVKSHKKQTTVDFMFFMGYFTLYPGNLEMNRDIAKQIGNKAKEGHFDKITFDGHESSTQTGHGAYAMNDTMKTVYEINKDHDMIYTSSRITNYCWNIISYISWGEFDKHKGFRGTMLDYRIRRQLQLGRSLIPKKMGQHYPSGATVKDINWLMGLATGWNSGVELDIHLNTYKNNPQRKELSETVRRWEKARISRKLTEEQLMKLRQVDCQYTISENKDGSWNLQLEERWQHPTVEKLSSSVIKLIPADSSVKPEKCSIDLSWTHSPLVFAKAAILDDIPLFTKSKNVWTIKTPGKFLVDINQKQFQFVLRIPADSPCGIKNPIFTRRGFKPFMVPVTLKPGQYMAAPLNIPMVFIYDKNHKVVKEIHLRYSNDLFRIAKSYTFGCEFESAEKGKTPKAILNIMHSEIIQNPGKKH